MEQQRDYAVEHTDGFVHVSFPHEREVLSSAVLNGGLVRASHLLNLKVDGHKDASPSVHADPARTLSFFAETMGWKGPCIGMMTAASMKSYHQVLQERDGLYIDCLVTTGVSNARRAGDRADMQSFEESVPVPGTINTVLLTNAHLSFAALVEAVMVATEAKAAALEALGILSPVSGLTATGTGTDSFALVHGSGGYVRYCGKHVLFGELIGKAVAEAICHSVQRYRNA